MNVFEVIMYLMSRVKSEDEGIDRKLAEAVKELKDNVVFRKAIGNHRDNWQKVKARFDMADAILEGLYD